MDKIQQAKKLRETYMQGMEALIIAEVKRIMRIHKNLVGYTDQMGSQSFKNKQGEPIFLISSRMTANWNTVYEPTYKTFNVLCDLYGVLDWLSLGLDISQEERRYVA